MCELFCLERIVTNAVTFFVVVNPIGLVPLFIAATRQETPESRRSIALRSVIIAASILIVFIAVGQILLNAMGITLPSFRIAGGLVLLAISMKMILADEPNRDSSERRGGGQPGREQDLAVFPLAMPFIAGPGTIMAAVLLTDNDQFSIPQQAVTTLILLIVLAFTYGMMRAADTVYRAIGTTGANVLNRVMGLVLAALAVQATLEGVRAAFSTH
jgi:multiple antibiotic resistance protein